MLDLLLLETIETELGGQNLTMLPYEQLRGFQSSEQRCPFATSLSHRPPPNKSHKHHATGSSPKQIPRQDDSCHSWLTKRMECSFSSKPPHEPVATAAFYADSISKQGKGGGAGRGAGSPLTVKESQLPSRAKRVPRNIHMNEINNNRVTYTPALLCSTKDIEQAC